MADIIIVDQTEVTEVVIVDQTPETKIDITVSGVGPKGLDGPVGPPGPEGGSGYTLPTNSAIGGNRAVATGNIHAVYAGSDTMLPAVGVSMGAASSGNDVTLQTGGKMLVTSAGWTPDYPVFLGVNGTLTQTEPTSGISQKLGVAHDQDILLIDIKTHVILV